MAAAVLILALVGVGLGQNENNTPFPDVLRRSRTVTPFNDQAPKIALKGVITQQAARVGSNYKYFWMAVRDDAADGGIRLWAVLLWGTDSQVENLKPGKAVSIMATPVKDGTYRAELVQGPTGPLSGLIIP